MRINNSFHNIFWACTSVIFYFPGTVFSAEKFPLQAAPPASPGVSSGSLLQVTLGLLTVLAVIVGIAWILRRYGRIRSEASGSLKILGGLFIGPRERVVLLQVGDTQLLVGVAPGRVQTLHVLDTPLPSPEMNPSVDAEAYDLKSFAGRLSAAIKQRKSI